MRIFKIAPKQTTALSGVVIHSTEKTEPDIHISNLYYGHHIFNFRFEIHDTIHKVHLLQLSRSTYNSGIANIPYKPDALIQQRHEGQPDDVTLGENHEVEFNFPDFQRMCSFSSKISAHIGD